MSDQENLQTQTETTETENNTSQTEPETAEIPVEEPDFDTEITDTTEASPPKTNLRSRILLIFGIVILVILLIGGSLILSVLRQLRGEHVPIVDRESEYVIPTMEADFETFSPEDLETLEQIGDDPIPVETETETTPITETTPVTTEAVTAPVKEPTSNPSGSGSSAGGTTSVKKPIPIYKQEKIDENILNVLLLGRDARNPSVEYGRTDTMIVLSYNKKTHEAKLVSLMRDTFIPIEGHDWNRINTAYAFGGIGLCINTVNDVFQLDIQDYMTIDFNGLVSVIDSIGGIDITLTPDEVALYQERGTLSKDTKAGVVHLNGSQALEHARNRSLGSDFERTRRQRDILMAVFDRVTSSMSLTDVTNLISATLKMVTTNLSASNILSLATDVMTNRNDITFENGRIPFNGTYEGKWYVKDGYKMNVVAIDIVENVKQLHKLLYD